jgi:hypothetical protein
MEAKMKPFVIVSLFVATLASTASIAQTATLPLQSPAEREVQHADSALQQKLQQLQQSEQNQFERNQVETNQLRRENQPNATIGPGDWRGGVASRFHGSH